MASGPPSSESTVGNYLPRMRYSVPRSLGAVVYFLITNKHLRVGMRVAEYMDVIRSSLSWFLLPRDTGSVERIRGFFDRADAVRRSDVGSSTRCGGVAVPSSGGGSCESDGVPSLGLPAGSSWQFEGTDAGQPCPPARMHVPQRSYRGRFRVNRRSGSFRRAEPVGTA